MAKAIIFLVALLMVLGLAVFLGPLRPAKSRIYLFHVCTGCGLQKSVKEARLGPVTYHRGTCVHPTAVSNAIGTNQCQHSWLLYNSGGYGAKAKTGKVPTARRNVLSIQVLLDDKMAASELARMDNPRENWRLLVTALTTNQALNDSLVQWSQALPYRSFRKWWQQSSLAGAGAE